MLFDPAWVAEQPLLARGSALRRWLKRLFLLTFLLVCLGAALLLFAPLL
ncbi:MAG: hypothetical protein Tsb0032_22810 [Kiloniellaceae bacterium]